MKRSKYIKVAKDLFQKKEFDLASVYYSLAYNDSKDKRESEIGVILCDLAATDPDRAFDCFYLYYAIRQLSKNSAYSVVKSLAEYEEETDLIELPIDGISYDEFKFLVEKTKNFEEIFKKIITSTKIILKDKDELFKFIEELIANDHSTIALEYIDKISSDLIGEERVRALLEKIGSEIQNNKK